MKTDPRFNRDEYNTYIRIFRLLADGQSYASARKLAKDRKIDYNALF